MGVQTNVSLICDRCAAQDDSHDSDDEQYSGEVAISEATEWGYWDGDLLCHECMDAAIKKEAGFACVVCGGLDGPMVPCGVSPQGVQTFRHPECDDQEQDQ